MYQKCPVCKSKGVLKNNEQCPTCSGERIIHKENGLPPSKQFTYVPAYPVYPVYPLYPTYPYPIITWQTSVDTCGPHSDPAFTTDTVTYNKEVPFVWTTN